MSQASFLPDKRWQRRALDAAAAEYDEVAVLQREVADRLLERLEVIRLEPRRVLDVGAVTGYASRALQKRYRGAEVLALEVSTPMLRHARRRGRFWRPLQALCADPEQLPLREGSVDMIFSNLALHRVHDLDRAFAGFLRVLRPGGLLMFASYGPDTLRELRASWGEVDGYQHVNAFIDMHDIGDALVRGRFADPVMDVETFTLTYERLPDLYADLRRQGARNVTGGRRPGLTAPAALARVGAVYERHRDAQGRLPATFEVAYGHAWAPEQRPQRVDAQGAVAVPLSSLRRRR